MRRQRAYCGLVPPRPVGAGQLAYRVVERSRGKVTSDFLTVFLPEALADLLIKARRPINRPLHDGLDDDTVTTEVTPSRDGEGLSLLLDIFDKASRDRHAAVSLSTVISDGSLVTGLRKGSRGHQDPLYAIARQHIAEKMMSEFGERPYLLIALTCSAGSREHHPFWRSRPS